MVKSIQHHIKYEEIHGVDEVVTLTMSEHKKLHIKLRKEGKCGIPPDELEKISNKARKRSKKGIEYEQSEKRKEAKARYKQSEKGKEVNTRYDQSEKVRLRIKRRMLDGEQNRKKNKVRLGTYICCNDYLINGTKS